MDHLSEYRPREVVSLSDFTGEGWHIKRYAIIAEGRFYNESVSAAAGYAALKRLPAAGSLSDAEGNHGIAIQIVHFAEVAVVSPVFYWRWGSVLASLDQMRASWEAPIAFEDGIKCVVGCVWEMDVVSYEIAAWKATVLGASGTPQERRADYLMRRLT